MEDSTHSSPPPPPPPPPTSLPPPPPPPASQPATFCHSRQSLRAVSSFAEQILENEGQAGERERAAEGTELKAEEERCCRCCEGSVAAVAALLQLCCSCCSSVAEWCCHCCHMRSADCGGTSWSERLQYATASASLEQRIWTTWQRYPCASARRTYVSYSQCWHIFYSVSFCTFVPGKKEEIRLVLPMLACIHIASVFALLYQESK